LLLVLSVRRRIDGWNYQCVQEGTRSPDCGIADSDDDELDCISEYEESDGSASSEDEEGDVEVEVEVTKKRRKG
jgi:hypothetical protein